MECPKCRFENRDGVAFCEECGAKLELICPECGGGIPLGRKFCGNCGHRLVAAEKTTVIDYDRPQSYTPKHLIDKILTTRTAIEGERKLVTVLFADVVDSTAMFENLDPEDVHEIMDGCFRILLDEVHQYEGTVNQFRGDGVMALFGAPIAHEDHAGRACHASLAILKKLIPYAEKLKGDYGINFRMRMGLNSGPVVVAAIGDDLRMDYTAQGDTANLASRMESSAEPGTILVSEHTHRLARDFFNFEPRGTIRVKGKQAPVKVYRLLGSGEIETRMAASTAKGLTRFVGRRRELEALEEAFLKTASGQGQAVGIVGEAGVGKSRLLLELLKVLPREGFDYFEGRCLHYGSAMPYLPILDIFRSFVGIKEGDPEAAVEKKIEERILGLDENLRDAIPPLADLLSLPVKDAEYAKLEPKERRERAFEAIRNVLIRGSQEKPLVLAVEDLHWIDKTSQEFLEYTIGWLPNTRILLILLYRPEYTHPWGSKSWYVKIGLDQLSDGTSVELVRNILEGGQVAPELRNLILGRASGNPFFMEELAHSLLENGSILKQRNQYVLAAESGEIHVPDTVQGIIAARMDRLEEGLKRIMQVASVIGREFAFRILQAIADTQEDLKSKLLNLQGLEFIYEKNLFPELEYIFRHALTQEVAYNSLLIRHRKEIHGKIGRAMEKLYSERLEAFYEMLAYHYARSGVPNKAYEYLKKSGDKACKNDALNESVRFFRDAMEMLSRLPATHKNKKEKLELVLSASIPLRMLGRYTKEYLPMLQQAEALAEELGEEQKRVYIRSIIGLYYMVIGDATGDVLLGWKYLEECMDHPDMAENAELAVPIGFNIISSFSLTGEFTKTCQIAPTIIDLIERSGTRNRFFGTPYNVYPFMLAVWGIATGVVAGDFDRGEKLLEKGLSHALHTDHQGTLGFVEWHYGMLYAIKGDGERAAEHLRNAARYMEESQTAAYQGPVWSFLGLAHLFMGEPETAVEFARKGLQMHTNLGIPFFQSMCHCLLSHIHLELGQVEKVRAHTELALKSPNKNNERQFQGYSRIILGMALAKTKQGQAEAEQQILQGIKQLEALGLRPWYCVGYLGLGEVYAEMGRKEEALRNLKKAEKMFQKMGMDYWLAKTRKFLAETGLESQPA